MNDRQTEIKAIMVESRLREVVRLYVLRNREVWGSRFLVLV